MGNLWKYEENVWRGKNPPKTQWEHALQCGNNLKKWQKRFFFHENSFILRPRDHMNRHLNRINTQKEKERMNIRRRLIADVHCNDLIRLHLFDVPCAHIATLPHHSCCTFIIICRMHGRPSHLESNRIESRIAIGQSTKHIYYYCYTGALHVQSHRSVKETKKSTEKNQE